MPKSFYEIFPKGKALIGMLHLAGNNSSERLNIAMKEAKVFDRNGFDGVIVEDYYGTLGDVENTLKELKEKTLNLSIGVNCLGNWKKSFELAQKYDSQFIQIDSIHPKDIDSWDYFAFRKTIPEISVFGGVNFKYQTQERGAKLEKLLFESMERCEAVVTTGRGTGIETPLNDIINIKSILGKFPLIIGAGADKNNIDVQLAIADGAIIGSYVKGCGSYFGTDLNLNARVKQEYVLELAEIRDELNTH
ncbi:hypothetical protein K9L16_02465 [Candidatus Pacearchaeota archaeon]|nr:hypothetical protein [Candidatus Pacearchaeota archaeon]